MSCPPLLTSVEAALASVSGFLPSAGPPSGAQGAQRPAGVAQAKVGASPSRGCARALFRPLATDLVDTHRLRLPSIMPKPCGANPKAFEDQETSDAADFICTALLVCGILELLGAGESRVQDTASVSLRRPTFR